MHPLRALWLLLFQIFRLFGAAQGPQLEFVEASMFYCVPLTLAKVIPFFRASYV